MTRISKSDNEWQALLTPEQYRVARQGGTERPFSGPYHHNHTPGTYRCICCDAPLFRTSEQYDAGTGWPSFSAAAHPENIGLVRGTSYLIHRTEVRCLRCDAHLGHAFHDGPPPTGRRFSLNSAALRFEPAADFAPIEPEAPEHPPERDDARWETARVDEAAAR